MALAACGDDDASRPAAATPAGTATAPDGHAGEAGLPAAVRAYYGDEPHVEHDDELASIEAEYHQPPSPARAAPGEVITLTGTNIGVRLRVRLLGPPEPVRVGGRDYLAARLRIRNTGITIFEAPLDQARLVDASGTPARPARGVTAPCSRGFDGVLRLDVSRAARGCILFPAAEAPSELRLALEQVPADAGGRWAL